MFSRHTSRVSAVVNIVAANLVLEVLDREHAVVGDDRPGGDAEQLGVGALLVVEDVAARVAEKLVARLAVEPHADLVAHRARGDEQRRLLAEQLGDALFEPADRGVFAEHVVAHLGGGHGGPHARAWGG